MNISGAPLPLSAARRSHGVSSFLKAHGKTDMVEKEMFVLKLIKHPNIIELITHFETEDKFYLVFPVATGGELFDRIVERKRFTEKDAAIIMATVINVGWSLDWIANYLQTSDRRRPSLPFISL